MKSFIRNALLGAAGLVALSLPAGAVSPTATTDSPVLKNAQPIQLAQAARPYDPAAGSVGFKKKAKKKAKKKKAKK